MGKLTEDLVRVGETLGGRWVVLRKLGGGGFGQVYRARDKDGGGEVAVKVEPRSKKEVLPLEAVVFEALRGRPHCPSFYGQSNQDGVNFLVMELLGKNLADLRRESLGIRTAFSFQTTFLLAGWAVEAIEDIHRCGHLHRDIKPSNYVMGLSGTSAARHLYLIDFGLARPLFDSSGRLREQRPPGGFRGTVKYASPAAHDGLDLARKDDLWSLFYMIVEMGRGSLPWRRIKEKADVGRNKKHISLEELCEGLPNKLMGFGRELGKYNYSSKPNYFVFKELCTDLLHDAGGNRHSLLDWDDHWTRLIEQQNKEPVPKLKRKKSLPYLTETATAGAQATGTRTPRADPSRGGGSLEGLHAAPTQRPLPNLPRSSSARLNSAKLNSRLNSGKLNSAASRPSAGPSAVPSKYSKHKTSMARTAKQRS